MSKVFVAGSINMDVVATAARYPKIGETVPGKEVFFFPGGKGANQAVSAAKLGAGTALIGRIGSDAFGRELMTFLAAQGVDLTFVHETDEAHTGTAAITVVDADNAIVVVPGANALVSKLDIAAPAFSKGDVLVSQFEIPVPTIEAFFARARSAGARTILNPAPAIEFNHDLLRLVDVLILNESELAFLTGLALWDSDPYSRFIEVARSLQGRKDQVICVTLGKRGAVAVIDGEPVIVPGRIVKAVDATGAGDCFVGAVAAQLAGSASVRGAIEFANAAASICVQRMGAGPSMPTKAEVASMLERISA